MKAGLKEEFVSMWQKYFGQAELPITFYYTSFGACSCRACFAILIHALHERPLLLKNFNLT